MKKILFFLILFTSFLFSFEKPTVEDFQSCFTRNKNFFVELEGVKAISITKNLAISAMKPKKFIKYDPFLKLYLIKSNENLYVLPKEDERKLKKSKWIASIDDSFVSIGHKKLLGENLGKFDEMNVKTKKNSVIMGACSIMYGIGVGENYFIGNRYLNHFAKYEDVYYGDIGVSFINKNNKILVESTNPFLSGANLFPNDEIISINDKTIFDLRTLKEEILFSEKNSKIKLKIIRNGKEMTLAATALKRNLSFNDTTFLGHLGMVFDNNLKLIKIQESSVAQKMGLKIGDRLMEINQKKVKNPSSVRQTLSVLKKYPYNFLFERDDFQFFTKVEK